MRFFDIFIIWTCKTWRPNQAKPNQAEWNETQWKATHISHIYLPQSSFALWILKLYRMVCEIGYYTKYFIEKKVQKGNSKQIPWLNATAVFNRSTFFLVCVCVCFSNCIFTGHSLVNCNVLHFTFNESIALLLLVFLPFHSLFIQNRRKMSVSNDCYQWIMSHFICFLFLWEKKRNIFIEGSTMQLSSLYLQIINTFKWYHDITYLSTQKFTNAVYWACARIIPFNIVSYS